jgi:hypothetical protein
VGPFACGTSRPTARPCAFAEARWGSTSIRACPGDARSRCRRASSGRKHRRRSRPIASRRRRCGRPGSRARIQRSGSTGDPPAPTSARRSHQPRRRAVLGDARRPVGTAPTPTRSRLEPPHVRGGMRPPRCASSPTLSPRCRRGCTACSRPPRGRGCAPSRESGRRTGPGRRTRCIGSTPREHRRRDRRGTEAPPDRLRTCRIPPGELRPRAVPRVPRPYPGSASRLSCTSLRPALSDTANPPMRMTFEPADTPGHAEHGDVVCGRI